MQKYEFVGYVCRVSITNFGNEIVVRTDADETAVKFKQHLLFSISKKSQEKVPSDIGENDKVKVTFIPMLNEGVSEKTKRAYAINKMMLSEIEILEKAQSTGTSDVDDSDIPF